MAFWLICLFLLVPLIIREMQKSNHDMSLLGFALCLPIVFEAKFTPIDASSKTVNGVSSPGPLRRVIVWETV